MEIRNKEAMAMGNKREKNRGEGEHWVQTDGRQKQEEMWACREGQVLEKCAEDKGWLLAFSPHLPQYRERERKKIIKRNKDRKEAGGRDRKQG